MGWSWRANWQLWSWSTQRHEFTWDLNTPSVMTDWTITNCGLLITWTTDLGFEPLLFCWVADTQSVCPPHLQNVSPSYHHHHHSILFNKLLQDVPYLTITWVSLLQIIYLSLQIIRGCSTTHGLVCERTCFFQSPGPYGKSIGYV